MTRTRLPRLHRWTVALLLAASALRCGDEPGRPTTPSTIEAVSGDGQVGIVSQPLADPLVVSVKDESGNPVAGVDVTWAVQNGGSVSAATVPTDESGLASVQRVLGPTAGDQTTTATVSGLEGSPVTFTSTAEAPDGPFLAATTQPSTTATSGTPLATQPIVQLRDANGDDVTDAGVAVTASIASGSGTLGGTVTRTTDANGRATFTDLVITGANGSYTLRFSADGYNDAVSTTITVGGSSGDLILLTVNPPVAALTGEVFDPAAQPVVQVNATGGAPAPNVVVTATVASGSGTLEGTATATTDAAGVARFRDLGIAGTGSHTLEFTAGSGSVTSSPIAVSALPAEATTGKWDTQIHNWDIVPLHMALFPNGKIFGLGKRDGSSGTAADSMGMPRLWDPAAGEPTTAAHIPVDTMLFCMGHTLLPDGRLMTSGGHMQDDRGIAVTFFFGQDGSVTRGPDMAHGRWYPTVTVLPDERVLTMAGRDGNGTVVTTPEIFENGAWVELPGAGNTQIPYYPRNFVAPDGRIFMAGERISSLWFEVDATAAGGRGRWTDGPNHIYAKNRDYGTAVMYDAGKILYAGGAGDVNWPTPDAKDANPTATAEKIDLTAGSPAWTSAGSMSAPRRHLNSTVLPDGQVLITGGTSGSGFVNISEALAVKQAEMWNPATNQWTTLAANQRMRVYHSVAMLLPDGTVLHGASGDAMAGTAVVPPERNHEIFQPPYLFKGARPTITSLGATELAYNQTFAVTTPNIGQITSVRWIRLGSVTHAFDMGQRANTLSFTPSATGVDVTTPASPNLAPPGYYMVFVLNRNGVPSAGKVVRIR